MVLVLRVSPSAVTKFALTFLQMVDNQEDEEDLKLSPAELKESLVRSLSSSFS